MNHYQFWIDLIGCIVGVFYCVTFFKMVWKDMVPSLMIRLFLYTVSGACVLIAPTFFRNTSMATVFIIFAVFLNSLAFRTTLFFRIYYSFVAIIVTTIGELYTVLIMRNVTGYSIEELQSDPQLYFATSMLVNLMQLLLMTMAVIIFKRALNLMPKGHMTTLLLPFTTILMIVLFLVMVKEKMIIKYTSQIFCVNALLVASNLSILAALERRYSSECDHEDLITARMQLKNQINYTQQLNDSINRAFKVTHDITNNLIALTGYLKENRVDRALSYLEERINQVSSAITVITTGCPTLDVILQRKLEDARACHAELDIRISLPDQLHIDEMDLANIVANALDNAIEEMSNLDMESDRKILLRIYYRYEHLSITVENHTHLKSDREFKTSKIGRHHGYGIRNIKEMAKKYGGTAKVTCANHRFRIAIMLKNVTQ